MVKSMTAEEVEILVSGKLHGGFSIPMGREAEPFQTLLDDPSANVRCPRCGGFLKYSQSPSARFARCPECRLSMGERGL